MKLADFSKRQSERFSAFRRALTEESDRGCALFAAAFLDKALSDLLFVSLVDSKKKDSELFKQSAPLSTFSARIKLAYYLGKISPSERHDLEIIRAIRNDFAHHPEYLSFEDQSISDRCDSLHYVWHEPDHRARGKFTAAVSGLLASVNVATFNSVAPVEKPEFNITDEMKAQIRINAEAFANQALFGREGAASDNGDL